MKKTKSSNSWAIIRGSKSIKDILETCYSDKEPRIFAVVINLGRKTEITLGKDRPQILRDGSKVKGKEKMYEIDLGDPGEVEIINFPASDVKEIILEDDPDGEKAEKVTIHFYSS